MTYQAQIDQMTDRALVEKWIIARIDQTLRALLRAGGAEMGHTKTPPKVVIDDLVVVAQDIFADSKETNFVTAVLEHMEREAQPAEV